jgi:hypothetical protein
MINIQGPVQQSNPEAPWLCTVALPYGVVPCPGQTAEQAIRSAVSLVQCQQRNSERA